MAEPVSGHAVSNPPLTLLNEEELLLQSAARQFAEKEIHHYCKRVSLMSGKPPHYFFV